MLRIPGNRGHFNEAFHLPVTGKAWFGPSLPFSENRPPMFLSAAARRFVITIPPFSRSRDGELKEPAEEEPENANYYRFDDSFQWSSLAAVGRRCRLSPSGKKGERISDKQGF